jgi:hypothetical protein
MVGGLRRFRMIIQCPAVINNSAKGELYVRFYDFKNEFP